MAPQLRLRSKRTRSASSMGTRRHRGWAHAGRAPRRAALDDRAIGRLGPGARHPAAGCRVIHAGRADSHHTLPDAGPDGITTGRRGKPASDARCMTICAQYVPTRSRHRSQARSGVRPGPREGGESVIPHFSHPALLPCLAERAPQRGQAPVSPDAPATSDRVTGLARTSLVTLENAQTGLTHIRSPEDPKTPPMSSPPSARGLHGVRAFWPACAA